MIVSAFQSTNNETYNSNLYENSIENPENNDFDNEIPYITSNIAINITNDRMNTPNKVKNSSKLTLNTNKTNGIELNFDNLTLSTDSSPFKDKLNYKSFNFMSENNKNIENITNNNENNENFEEINIINYINTLINKQSNELNEIEMREALFWEFIITNRKNDIAL